MPAEAALRRAPSSPSFVASFVASFPNSVWERPPGNLCFPSGGTRCETEFRERAFPNRVWERESTRVPMTTTLAWTPRHYIIERACPVPRPSRKRHDVAHAFLSAGASVGGGRRPRLHRGRCALPHLRTGGRRRGAAHQPIAVQYADRAARAGLAAGAALADRAGRGAAADS